jgi:hypothetical protein
MRNHPIQSKHHTHHPHNIHKANCDSSSCNERKRAEDFASPEDGAGHQQTSAQQPRQHDLIEWIAFAHSCMHMRYMNDSFSGLQKNTTTVQDGHFRRGYLIEHQLLLQWPLLSSAYPFPPHGSASRSCLAKAFPLLGLAQVPPVQGELVVALIRKVRLRLHALKKARFLWGDQPLEWHPGSEECAGLQQIGRSNRAGAIQTWDFRLLRLKAEGCCAWC